MSEQNKPNPAGDDKKQGGNHHYRRHGKRPYHHGKRHNKPRNPDAPLQTDEALQMDEAVVNEEETVITEAEEIPEITVTSPEPAQGEEPQALSENETVPETEEVPVETTEVIGVRFRTSGKIYYFDPKGLTYPLGCHAIVDTARGTEYGEVAMTNRLVPTSELVLPLREALRIATAEDDRHHAENKAKEAEAGEVWVKKVALHGLEMKLIDVECTFDNSKLLFYFTAEGRVDFRDLVKDLASVFRCRIELRQMGIRDEAKILGGLGVCGRPFCCHSFLPDFVQVSIKMAKEQNLSLNSAKISGACGRLMCCLRYEYDTYLEEAKLTPLVDSLVRTPDGVGTVVETKPLLGLVKVQPVNSPDAPAVVYSRDLLTPIKPGEPIEVPAPAPAPIPDIKEKIEKQSEAKKSESAPKPPKPQIPKKRPEPATDKKKAEGEHPKKNEKQPHKVEKAEVAVKESGTKEHKYVIHRAGDNSKDAEAPVQSAEKSPKKRYGYHHHRQHKGGKDSRDKKGSES